MAHAWTACARTVATSPWLILLSPALLLPRFECKSDGSYLTIQHASLEPADGDYDDSVYTGPAYEELDEALRGEFDQYLAARGVTPDLGAYLLRLVHDKEQREYTHWLERVHAFVG